MLLAAEVCQLSEWHLQAASFSLGPTAAEFLGVMARDIRSYDSEQDIRNAWKVRVALLVS